MAVAGTVGIGSEVLAEQFGCDQTSEDCSTTDRQERVFDIRRDSAATYLQEHLDPQMANADKRRYNDFRASFFKTLPQNDLAEVYPAAFGALRRALAYGKPELFGAGPQSFVAERGLVNPQAALAYELYGPDSHAVRITAGKGFPTRTAECFLAL